MKFQFKVVRRTSSYDEHTVQIEADSYSLAKQMAEQGLGEYVSFDRDELDTAEIVQVTPKNS